MGLKERQWINNHWQILLREIAYHKEHREAQGWPSRVIWRKDKA